MEAGHPARVDVSLNSGGVTSVLSHAVLIYTQTGSSSNFDRGYASVHPVHDHGGRPLIGAGVPATASGLAALARALMPEAMLGPKLIDRHILCRTPEVLVWWRPPQDRHMFFSGAGLGGPRSGIAPQPGYISVVTRSAWYLFAVRGRTRPTGRTRIYVAPWMNIWKDGKLCEGNLTRPSGDVTAAPEEWDDVFFGSAFTHFNDLADRQIVRYAEGPHKLWKDLLDGKFTRFPGEVLVPMLANGDGKRRRATVDDLFAFISEQLEK